MNQVKVQQTGGFPHETDTIDRLQSNLLLMQAFGNAFGPLAILEGAVTSGATVSDGAVYINGEVLEFRGAALGPNVVIVQEAETRPFQDGKTRDVFITRYATFGTATTSYPWADFVRPKNLADLSKMQRVVGEIIDWFGNPAAIPTCWAICDGTNGTPDLRGRMTVGYDSVDVDYDTVGKIGGFKTVTLTEAQIPSHTHTGSTANAGAHSHSISLKGGESDGGNSGRELRQNTELGIPKTVTTDSQGSHTHAITVNATGGGQPHENRSPYMVMLKLMWVG